ncbi:hypothetical protein [Comamonas sp.]|uniref:hypothetical protein n=1 Tax=Comamonas sp. TaxID=34028 RepID=UPI00289EBFB1|nr:hypothetical protein [Comamonas sp.]
MSTPTKKQLAAQHTRRLKTMQKQLMAMAEQWEDLDQFCVNTLVELADQAEKTGTDLKEG